MRLGGEALPAGRYECVVEIHAPTLRNGPVRVPVKLTVLDKGHLRDVGDRKQLFIDERFIERSENVELNSNQPENFLLDYDPLKNSAHYVFQPISVFSVTERDLFPLYYCNPEMRCAESRNGIRWEKPDNDLNNGLPVIEFADETPNHDPEFRIGGTPTPPVYGISGGGANIFPFIFYNTHDVAEQRYKMLLEVSFSSVDADGYEQLRDLTRE